MPDARQRLAELEAVFAALAHASRRHILLVIRFRGGSMSAGEIAGRFHHTWPTISRHLRVLEAAGLLAHQKQGRTRFYRVNLDKLELVRGWLAWFDKAGKVRDGRTRSRHPPGDTRGRADRPCARARWSMLAACRAARDSR